MAEDQSSGILPSNMIANRFIANAQSLIGRFHFSLMLRYLSAERHKSFVGIVTNGLPAKGMPNYEGELTTEQIKEIQAYIIKRANDEKNRKAVHAEK